MFTVDELFIAVNAVSPWRASSACAAWNNLMGSEQQSALAMANGSASDLESCATYFANWLISSTVTLPFGRNHPAGLMAPWP